MFSGFDLGAGLSRLNATISSIQDELSQEHAKTVAEESAAEQTQANFNNAGTVGGAEALSPEEPAVAPKKKAIKKVVKKGAGVEAEAGSTEGEGAVKKKKVVKKVVKKGAEGSNEGGGGEGSAAKPKKKVVKRVAKKGKEEDTAGDGAKPVGPVASSAEPDCGAPSHIDVSVTAPGTSDADWSQTGRLEVDEQGKAGSPVKEVAADAGADWQGESEGAPAEPVRLDSDGWGGEDLPNVDEETAADPTSCSPKLDSYVGPDAGVAVDEQRVLLAEGEAGLGLGVEAGDEVAGESGWEENESWEDEGWGHEELVVPPAYEAQDEAEAVAGRGAAGERSHTGDEEGAEAALSEAVLQQQLCAGNEEVARKEESGLGAEVGGGSIGVVGRKQEAAIAAGVESLMVDVVRKADILMQQDSPIKVPLVARAAEATSPAKTAEASPHYTGGVEVDEVIGDGSISSVMPQTNWQDNPAFHSKGSTPTKAGGRQGNGAVGVTGGMEVPSGCVMTADAEALAAADAENGMGDVNVPNGLGVETPNEKASIGGHVQNEAKRWCSSATQGQGDDVAGEVMVDEGDVVNVEDVECGVPGVSASAGCEEVVAPGVVVGGGGDAFEEAVVAIETNNATKNADNIAPIELLGGRNDGVKVKVAEAGLIGGAEGELSREGDVTGDDGMVVEGDVYGVGGAGQVVAADGGAAEGEELDLDEDEDEEDDGQFAWADSHQQEEEAGAPGRRVLREEKEEVEEGSGAPRVASDPDVAEMLRRVEGVRAGGGRSPLATAVLDVGELEGKSWDDLAAAVGSLRAALAAREAQLQRKGEEVVMMQEVQDTLMERNEQLVRKAHKVSQEDVDELQKEFETRLGAAERKVYALTKERDALKRGAERAANMEGVLRQKDEAVRAAAAETAEVAKKHAEAQSSIKALQKQIQRLEAEQSRLSAKLVAEAQKTESVQQSKDRAEVELRSAYQRAATDMEAQRQHYEGLLARARESQQAAEERAQSAAKEGAARKAKESSAQAAALADTVGELRDALDRQRKAAELREEMLRQDVKDMEQRCIEAERRHEELSSKFPETTRPLLRQIESLQQAATAQEESWRVAEESLCSRLAEAEARSTAAAERERLASERLSGAQNRIAGIEAALEAVREDSAGAHAALAAAESARKVAEKASSEAGDALRAAHADVEALREERDKIVRESAEELDAERNARFSAVHDVDTVKRSCELRVASLQAELERLGGGGDGEGEDVGGPPAMAAPGYKWVLVKEGQEAVAPPPPTPSTHPAPAPSTTGVGAPRAGGAAPGAAPPPPSSSQHGYGGGEGLPEVERLRAAVSIKEGEVGALQAQVGQLEATRDSLAEELVAAMQAREASGALAEEMEELRQQYQALQTRHASAVELLGEREERLEEIREDLQDVKNMYRDQIEYMVEQVISLTPKNTPNLTPASSATFGPGDDLPVSTQAVIPHSLPGVDDDVPGNTWRPAA